MMDTDDLAVQANSYASANGIQVERRTKSTNDDASSTTKTTTYFEGAPMSLLPNAYPQKAFAQAVEVAPAFNELVDRVSRDAVFLEETLGGGVSLMDPYTAKILKLYKEVYVTSNENVPARTADRLGIHRSDYMLHKDGTSDDNGDYQLKQVELNTIASSFAGLSCKIANLHRYLTSRYDAETREFLNANIEKVSSSASLPAGVPSNPALHELPLGMKVAYDRYVERFGGKKDKDSKPVVLFVVQEGETNTVDQRLLEFALWENYGIPVVRRSLTRLDSELSVDEGGALQLSGSDGTSEIAVVYFRAGYAPTDYPDGDDGAEWKARLTLETSRATKCPCLGYHLAGTKKVQQELARPGVLERFFPLPEESDKVETMRACFAGLYSMGDDATPEDLHAAKDVLDGGHAKYVLKPQREGGGYNFYGDDLAKKLQENVVSRKGDDDTLTLSDELAEYILMQRLFPPQQTAILMRGGKVQGQGESISELGAFGTLVVDPHGKVLHNQYAGFLLRTKFSDVDEGGVASGFATLSSPYLC
jgi:glutathione synthetase